MTSLTKRNKKLGNSIFYYMQDERYDYSKRLYFETVMRKKKSEKTAYKRHLSSLQMLHSYTFINCIENNCTTTKQMHCAPSQHQTDAINTHITEVPMRVDVITWPQATDACKKCSQEEKKII